MNKQVIPLFGVPVLYIFDTQRFLSADELKIINSLEEIDNQNNLSKNTKILDIEGLENLKSFCQDQINTYARDVCGVSDQFYITNSWTARNKQGSGHHKHTHPNSIFSGVYYINASKDTAPLTLHCPSPIFKDFALQYHQEKSTVFNSSVWSFPVQTGTVIIFPSWVEHSSPPNGHNEDRRLIGFNSFVRGSFGDFNYCSDININ